jgi:hypothetical protein
MHIEAGIEKCAGKSENSKLMNKCRQMKEGKMLSFMVFIPRQIFLEK